MKALVWGCVFYAEKRLTPESEKICELMKQINCV